MNKDILVRHEELKEGIVKSNDKLFDNLKNYMDKQTDIIKINSIQFEEESKHEISLTEVKVKHCCNILTQHYNCISSLLY